MRSIPLVVTLVLIAAATSGCMGGFHSINGSGHVVTETREVSGIKGVEVAGSGKIILQQGDTERVEITADDNLMQYLTSEVTGSKLTLGTKDWVNVDPTDKVIYKVFVKDLNSLGISGSVEVEADGVRTDSLTVAVSGSGDIRISGQADEQKIAISGSANYEGQNLKSKETSLVVSGSGKAVLAVSEKLDVQVSGSGDVEYIGEPKVTQSISGSGSVKQRRS